MDKDQKKQRAYYEATAKAYDEMHLKEIEHEIALSQLLGYMRYFNFESLLDVGAGTGRVLRHANAHLDGVKLGGIEPVAALREIAYSKGVFRPQLTEGDALNLEFPDNSWDIVSAFGILHHIPDPEKAILEMCRVAKYGIFFSDLNNYGCGSRSQRALSQGLRVFGLWRSFQFIKNGGKMGKFSEGDGIHYSYSLFDSLPTVRRKFPQIRIANTKGSHPSLFRGCSHISLFAVASDSTIASRLSPLE